MRECRNQAGTDREQQRPAPPVRDFIEIAQHQPNGDRCQQGNQYRDGAGDEHRPAKQQVRQHLQVDAGAQVVVAAVLEVGGQEDAVPAVQVIPHQIGGEHGLHCLVGEEVNGETGQTYQAGDDVNQQGQGEEPNRQRQRQAIPGQAIPGGCAGSQLGSGWQCFQSDRTKYG